jgi:hypothetical protein
MSVRGYVIYSDEGEILAIIPAVGSLTSKDAGRLAKPGHPRCSKALERRLRDLKVGVS